MIPIKSLLFDFDGVLADTESFHWRAWRETLAPHSPELDWQTYQRLCIGVSDVEMRNIFCQLCRTPISSDEVLALYPLKRQVFQFLTSGANMIDGSLVAMLRGLDGLRLGVVTSSNIAEVEPILRQARLLDALGTVVYGNDVGRYKPDPEPYLLALERLDVEPTEAVVFEDSASGIRSAQDAGCRVVKVGEPSQLPGLIRTALSGGCDF